jgi:chemotaxis protein histidine kinase CheA/DNA-binding NarL/FixJ family response regulator
MATDPAIDEGFAAWTSALDVLISAIETNPACIVDSAAWSSLVDTANTWASLSPVADLLKDLVGQIASRSGEPIHAEGIAAGLCCLRESGDVNALRVAIQTMKQLLSSTEPRQCLNQLGQWSRAENVHRLFVVLISAMRSDMTQVEYLLDAEPPAEVATTLKAAVAVLTRISGALQLLGLTDERERVMQLHDTLGQKNTAAWMDETFAQQWVLLQTMLAQLPWQKTLQASQPSQPACVLDTIFIEEARALILVMRDYAAASDMAGMAQIAHTLGGCSATVGLSGLAVLSLTLESTLEQMLACGAVLDDVLLDTVLTTLTCLIEDFASHGVRGDASELAQCLREYSVVPGANDTVETLDLTINPFAQQEAGTILIDTLDEPVIDNLKYVAHDASDSSDSSDSTDSSELSEVALEIGTAPSPSQASSSSPSAATLTTATISSNRLDEQEELFEIFKLEAADLLPQLEQSLRQWQLHPEDGSQAAQLLRVLHTLKGSARMAGRDDLGTEFHHAEAEVSALLQQAPNSRVPAIAALLHRVDFWIYGLTQTADALSGLTPTSPHPATTELADDTQLAARLAAQRQPQPQFLEASVAPQQDSGSDNSASPVTSNAEKRLPMLRVRADRLTQFADTGAEIWSSNARLRELLQEQRRSFADLYDDLSRLRAQLRELEIEAESRVLARASQGVSTDFDPLEFDRYTRLHELTRMMAESITDVVGVQRGLASQLERMTTAAAEQLRDLRRQQSELQALRSQPLHSVEARLRHVLRQAAREVGCEVELELHHGSVEIERVLLDRLLGPLEHLLRNSVVHGIEQAQQRLLLGKSETGRVMISAALTGNELQLTVQDDGRGLDLQRIRQRAVEAGLLQADDDLDERALSAFIFAPGLSTATEVTALSGRGIGMDAVRAELHALGGQIEVESKAGQGCRFTLRVPMGLASVMVVLVRAGHWRIGLPAALVKQALQIDAATIRADTQQQIEWQGTTLPLRHLTQTLGDTTAPITKGRVPVVVLSDGEKTIALQLDAIEGQRELIVKHPGPQLSRVPGMAGASVLADGTIALIIHPFRLPETTSATALSASPASEQLATVLVVDDSLTVRRASQRFLERHGYAVALARDGVEALAYLGNDRPALILLDIEMPRMDGFELLATLRDDTRWRDIPVVMITSRMADRHRERAMQLGANAYMGKPYREDALLALLSEMLADGRSSKIVSDIVTNDPTKTTTNISINTATEIDSMTNMQTVSASN